MKAVVMDEIPSVKERHFWNKTKDVKVMARKRCKKKGRASQS